MARELIISISGMRGIIGENLYPEIAAAYAGAFGTFLRQSGVRGRRAGSVRREDSDRQGDALSAVAAGLSAVRVDVVDLGIVTTGVGLC